MRHLITGATGYVGGRLAPRLLADGDAVRCLVRDPAKLRDVPWARNAEVVRGDLLDEDAVRRACVGVDVVYFLVHSLVDRDFAAIDRRAATIVARAARDCGVRRIVYLAACTPTGRCRRTWRAAVRSARSYSAAVGPRPCCRQPS